MRKLRIWATISLILSALVLLLLFFMHLALTDIYHGEEDACLEWTILRLGFLVILFLVVVTFIGANLVLKDLRGRSGDEGRRPPE